MVGELSTILSRLFFRTIVAISLDCVHGRRSKRLSPNVADRVREGEVASRGGGDRDECFCVLRAEVGDFAAALWRRDTTKHS